MRVKSLLAGAKIRFNLLARELDYYLTRPYHIVRTAWPVWFHLLNKEGRTLYSSYSLRLSPLQSQLISDLKKNGLAVVHISDLFGDNEGTLLAGLQRYADSFSAGAQTHQAKKYLVSLWEKQPELSLENPLLALVLNNRVLDVVNGYMAMFSKLKSFSLNLTLPVAGGSLPFQSQRWHRDPEDKKMCKVFLYLNDVDEGSGPFVYIPASHHGGKWRRVFPQRPPKGVYPPPGAVEKIVPAEAIKVCTGRAGTLILADTSGLHKGGYAVSGERFMFTAGFSSRASRWGRYFTYPPDFERGLNGLNPAARYALWPPQ